jgi:hypothetical protein
MEKETKFVTVYWSDIVHKKTTIEVDKDEEDESYIFSLAVQQEPEVFGSEVEINSIEIFEE